MRSLRYPPLLSLETSRLTGCLLSFPKAAAADAEATAPPAEGEAREFTPLSCLRTQTDTLLSSPPAPPEETAPPEEAAPPAETAAVAHEAAATDGASSQILPIRLC